MENTDLRLVRLPQVCAVTATCRSAVYASIKSGLFVPPIKTGRIAAWPAHEVQVIVASRIAGASEEQLRRLVTRLVSARRSLVDRYREAGGTLVEA